MTALLAVALLLAGALAAGFRLRWILERGRADWLQAAFDRLHEDFGKSMDAYYRREADDRARKAQLRDILWKERTDGASTHYLEPPPTDPELDRIRHEEYARLVNPQ
jgi:hypothetical protein